MGRRTSEEYRRRFPNLVEEMGGSGTIDIRAARSSPEEAEKAAHWTQGYLPTAIDFIRRCENEGQALEVIKFLEAKREITPIYANRLRVQLAERGLGSFGKRRKPGCYERGETG